MTDQSDRSPPAFPMPEGSTTTPCYGLTQRQYFAAVALPALMRNAQGSHMCDWDEMLVRRAYEIADEMIKQGGVR